MQTRPLGRSGIAVAPLAFGANVFGWSVTADRADALLDAFVAHGLNLIDTADAYPAWVPGNEGGESETMIGRWLRRRGGRHRVVIATKVGKWARHRGLAPDTIRAAADASLQRLGIDHIDLYQAHADDASVPLEETLGAFSRLIEQGKVRAIGASNSTAPRLAEALAVSARHGLPRYETLQPEYNLYDRAGYEAELEPLAREHGLGVIGYYALASGFLSGKYRSEADLGQSAARGARRPLSRCARPAHPGRARRGRPAPRRDAGPGRAGLADRATRRQRADRERDQRRPARRARRCAAAEPERGRPRRARRRQRLSARSTTRLRLRDARPDASRISHYCFLCTPRRSRHASSRHAGPPARRRR